MHESQVPGRSILLPKRLLDRAPFVEPPENSAPGTPGQNTRGLAERIAALPGVTVRCAILGGGTMATDYFVDGLHITDNADDGPHLLCHIDFDGILLPRLGAMDRAEVIHKGWATPNEDSLTLFLPRDSIEMEIAWRIVLLTYQQMTWRPARTRTHGKISPQLPRYASAAKYWM